MSPWILVVVLLMPSGELKRYQSPPIHLNKNEYCMQSIDFLLQEDKVGFVLVRQAAAPKTNEIWNVVDVSAALRGAIAEAGDDPDVLLEPENIWTLECVGVG